MKIMLIIAAIFLTGCLGASVPEPIVIERTCAFAELREKPDLPEIEWVAAGECPAYRCLDKENYEKLKVRSSTVKTYANYVIKVYNDARERCQ